MVVHLGGLGGNFRLVRVATYIALRCQAFNSQDYGRLQSQRDELAEKELRIL